MSEVSSTDVALFRRLANPDVVNLEVELRPRGSAPAKRAREVVVEEAMREASAPLPQAPAASALKAAIAVQKENPPAEPEKAPAPPAPVAEPKQEPVKAKEAVEERPAKRRKREGADSSDDEERDAKNKKPGGEKAAGRAQDDEGDRLEKQGLLIELQNLESQGTKLTRTFTMSDTIAEMEFELNRHMALISTRNTVSFMRDSLRILISGMEIGNAKLGPFLSIDGWAESMTHDMHRYDHSLERVYKRYWRKQQMSPIMELAWLIVGSMLTWHFKTKFFGPQPRASQSSPAPPRDAGPKAAPPAASAAFRPGGQKRPTLRPPGTSLLSSVFG